MARPSKLTPDMRERITAAIRAGNFLEPAAAAHGVAPTTLYRWMALARAGRSPYREFRDAVERARCECELELVSQVRSQGPKSPTAVLALLQQLFPERWTPTERREVDVTEARKGPPPAVIRLLPSDRPQEEFDQISGLSTGKDREMKSTELRGTRPTTDGRC